MIVEPNETDASKSTVDELNEVILIIEFPEGKVYGGSGLTPELKRKLIEFLYVNAYCLLVTCRHERDFPRSNDSQAQHRSQLPTSQVEKMKARVTQE